MARFCPVGGLGRPLDLLVLPQFHNDGSHEAARLLKQMLALGISRYHPDPVAAIEDAQEL
jgi:hypothetical protein